uniref:Uncharacterized protein n=1 Tax=Heliothis virescens TaxID=7102 RepID=A0A2A4J546_HELVI
MWRWSCVAVLLSALLVLWGGADAAPLFGLLSLLSGGAANGTGLLESLVLAHLQEKINKLQVLGDLLAIAANSTG